MGVWEREVERVWSWSCEETIGRGIIEECVWVRELTLSLSLSQDLCPILQLLNLQQPLCLILLVEVNTCDLHAHQ